MAGLIGSGVTLEGLIPQDAAWTWNVSGTVTTANVGELVALDTTANSTVKLLGDGDAPIGVLGSYENRSIEGIKIGTVNHQGGFKVAYNGDLLVGDSVVGSATPGEVKASMTSGGSPVALPNKSLVVSVDSTNHTAVVIFI